MRKNKQGFTLIELLVVISIIGLLVTLSIISLDNARRKARDAKRKADLKQIHTALALYFDKYNTYPSEEWCDSSLGSCNHACPCEEDDWDYSNSNYIGPRLRNNNLMEKLPKDPKNDSTYYYWYEPDCNQGQCVGQGCCFYSMGARLEKGGGFTCYSDSSCR